MTAKKIVREPEGWNPPPWVAIRPTLAYFKAERMSPEECKAWVLDTLRGCMTGEREEGSDADRLLREAEASMAKRSNAGKVAADARWKQGQGCERNANALRTECERNANGMRNDAITRHDTTDTTKPTEQNRQTDTTDRPTARTRAGTGFGGGEDGPLAATVAKALATATAPEPSKGVQTSLEHFMQDPAGSVYNLPQHLMPTAMAAYCRDANDGVAQRGYEKEIRRAGAEAVRKAFAAFIRDTEAGKLDGARKLGALLMKTLQHLPAYIR